MFCDVIAGVSFGHGEEVSSAEAVIPLLHEYGRGKVGVSKRVHGSHQEPSFLQQQLNPLGLLGRL